MLGLSQESEGQIPTRLQWDKLLAFLAEQPYVSSQSSAGICLQSCGCNLGPNTHTGPTGRMDFCRFAPVAASNQKVMGKNQMHINSPQLAKRLASIHPITTVGLKGERDFSHE